MSSTDTPPTIPFNGIPENLKKSIVNVRANLKRYDYTRDGGWTKTFPNNVFIVETKNSETIETCGVIDHGDVIIHLLNQVETLQEQLTKSDEKIKNLEEKMADTNTYVTSLANAL